MRSVATHRTRYVHRARSRERVRWHGRVRNCHRQRRAVIGYVHKKDIATVQVDVPTQSRRRNRLPAARGQASPTMKIFLCFGVVLMPFLC